MYQLPTSPQCKK